MPCIISAQGTAGAKGIKGEKGEEGPMGPSGQAGFPGLKGEVGAKVSLLVFGFTIDYLSLQFHFCTEKIF